MKKAVGSLEMMRDFPLLSRNLHGKRIVYLDSTATSLKPMSVVEAVREYDTEYTANVFRGIYKISEKATEKYEGARKLIARFIGAEEPEEVIYTRNATEALNLVYATVATKRFGGGDEVVVTVMEHHSNFVPWQRLASDNGVKLKIWNVDKEGRLDYKDLNKLITRKTKLLTITAASNVIGTLVDIQKVVKISKSINPSCLVMVDAAQAVPHLPVDVKKWGADFIAFSGHKMLGPTGIGILWGKREHLEAMPPYQFGGDMIREVHLENTVFNSVPHKFEAGTPNISGAIGLGEAVSYLSGLGMENVRTHEQEITDYALKLLGGISGLTLYGPEDAGDRGGVVSFTLKGIHPHDIAQVLDDDNICIRVGFHCAQPLHEYLGIGPTARASFYVYTTKADIDALAEGLEKVKKVFA